MNGGLRIRWAPKLVPQKIVRLYHSVAAGLLDEELLDDVASALHARIADVMRVSRGRLVCPVCGEEFAVPWTGKPPETVSACPGCGWETTAGEYHRSWEHRDLNGGCDEFDRYFLELPRARTPQDKMLLVDRAVHALHVACVDGAIANFAARNFLEGNRRSIAAVLDGLAYGPANTVDAEARERWQETKRRYDESLSGRREKPQ